MMRRAILGLILVWALASAGSPPSATGQDVASEELKNARETARSLITAIATKGESVRGATGVLEQILRSSDELICQSWIIAFNLKLREMSVAGADPQVLGQLQQLQWKIEAACVPILGTAPLPPEGGGGTAKPSPAPSAAPPSGEGGKPFVPREGWTIEDEICARACSDEYGTYLAAVRKAAGLDERAQKARAAADQAAKEADDIRRAIQEQEAKRAEALRKHREIAAAGGTDTETGPILSSTDVHL